MSWRLTSTWFLLLLALAMLAVCVALVALRRSACEEPPSSGVAAIDPGNSDGTNEAPAQVAPASETPPHGVPLDANEPRNANDSTIAADAVGPSDLIAPEPSPFGDPAGAGSRHVDSSRRPVPNQVGETRGVIQCLLVDIEGNPVAGYVTLECTDQDPNTPPASLVAIPQPAHQPPEGIVGYAYDVSGELARRFIWHKRGTDEPMTIVLEPYAGIAGRLVDAQRRPLSSARLDLQMPMRAGRWRGDIATDTPPIDEEGYFHFDRVPVGSQVRVAARHGTLSGQSRQIVLTPGVTAYAGQIVMTGPRPGSGIVQGRITDRKGAPIANRSIMVRIGRRGQWLRTDPAGYYILTDLPTDRPLTIEVELAPYGPWSRTTTPDDFACDFALVPQGWGIVGTEAPPLFPARWFNHAPLTLPQLRGRVVLLTFRSFQQDLDPGLSRLHSLQRRFGPRGLAIVTVYDHLSVPNPLAADIVTEHLAGLFAGLPIAGFLDSDPALVADLMSPERPTAASAGATHWMYLVQARPAFFLIDKQGVVRHVTAVDSEITPWIERLLKDEGMSPTP